MKILDVITLSSTHLLFLKELLKKEFPKIIKLIHENIVATKVFSKIKNKQSRYNNKNFYF